MGTKYKRVAVIGAGPSGVAAVRALDQEGAFDIIRVFDQRHELGGTWIYDEIPDVFPLSEPAVNTKSTIPTSFPALTDASPPDPSMRTALYKSLDSNVGADAMAFTHTPFPVVNSAATVRKFGPNNPTRPWKVVKRYLEDLFKPYLHYLTLNTRVESIEKINNEWVLTLRRFNVKYQDAVHDYWWQERFDAVITATGHYRVPNLPAIPGLADSAKTLPGRFEHAKAWRSADNYVGKRVVIVGGNVSAVDLVDELYPIVQPPLLVSQRRPNEALGSIFKLPNVLRKPGIKSVSSQSGGTIEFTDGTTLSNFDKIIFATGYRLSYPFFPFPAVTPENRLSGFYQHIFKIGDPTLAVIGQVKGALTFRIFEYQAAAVAGFLAGRSRQLPSEDEQRQWETERLEYKGKTESFHEINPDFAEYFNWLRDFAGSPVEGTQASELPAFREDWIPAGFEILQLKNKHWEKVASTLSSKAKL